MGQVALLQYTGSSGITDEVDKVVEGVDGCRVFPIVAFRSGEVVGLTPLTPSRPDRTIRDTVPGQSLVIT